LHAHVFLIAFTRCRHFIHIPSFNCFLSNSYAMHSQNTALNCAATKGRLQVCKFLVHSGADIKARSWCGIRMAPPSSIICTATPSSNHLDLGSHVRSPSRSWGRTALKSAIAQGKTDVAAYLRRQPRTLRPSQFHLKQNCETLVNPDTWLPQRGRA
jgi:ankyrin repeat protein